ncbi:MAG: ribosome biogenesis GTPase Der [Nitrospirae bacterium]|nr:ribosome biogenesis GTPase Der [Nitrospirota bacterium]
MTLPTVAIVGRVNVGKSTLFNAILGYERSVADPTPGVTRDRVGETVQIRGVTYRIEDTGGLEPGRREGIQEAVNRQAEAAIENADYVVLVVDQTTGCHPLDEENARTIRKKGKPFCVAVNKMDVGGQHLPEAVALSDFHRLAAEKAFPIAAVHRRGIGPLMDFVRSRIRASKASRSREQLEDLTPIPPMPPTPEADQEPTPAQAVTPPIHVAIVGRPNAGKSTLLNTLLGEARMMTDPQAGTTRDVVDADLVREGRRYVFTDSAGIRRRARVGTRLEEKSVGQALRSIDHSDVSLLVMDVREPGAVQDVRLGYHALKQGKGLVLILTQCDRVTSEDSEKAAWAVRSRFPHLNFCPILKLSGLTGVGTQQILPLTDRLDEQLARHVPDEVAQESLKKALAAYQPPRVGGRGYSIRTIRQTGSRPPAFTLTVHPLRRVPDHYQTFLLHHFQRDFRLHEVPIRLHFRPWIGRHPKS